MADRNSNLESSGVSAEHETCASSSCETMLWDGWATTSQASAVTADDATHLPELAASSRALSFHRDHADMLSTMLSHFHPLGAASEDPPAPGPFFQPEPAESEATVSFTKSAPYLNTIPSRRAEDLPGQFVYSKPPPLQPWQPLTGPSSPSSPLALHNARWDAHASWPGASIQLVENSHHNASRILIPTTHSEMHNLAAQPSAWGAPASPEAYSMLEPGPRGSTRSQQFMNFVRIAQEQRPSHDPDSAHVRGYGDYKPAPGPKTGKHRGEESTDPRAPKRPHLQAPVDHGTALWRNPAHGHRSLYPPSAASQAMEIFAIGPALNTNGKPRARRGSATDPQSVYARHRREKINERLKTLQHLVPNGAKVDIVTMLDEAVHYVQFLQLQVKLLKSDQYWIHATPNTYKGIDLTSPPTQTQGLGSSV